MRRNPVSIRLCGTFLSGSLIVVLTAWAMPTAAQENAAQQDANEGKQAAFPQEFWDYLQQADYQKNWSRWPGHEDMDFTEGRSPHGDFLKVYVNQQAKSNPDDPPMKSIIVKENYNQEKELVAITPMYRVSENYDPDHNNWYWAKYKPDGSLFESNGMKMSGKLQGCIDCHSSAKGNDFIFTNDK